MNYHSIKNDRNKMKIEHNRSMKKVACVMFIIITFLIIGIGIFGIYELRTEREILKKNLETKESEKYNLSKINFQNERLVESYKNENMRLINELSNYQNNRNKIQTNNTYLQPEPSQQYKSNVKISNPEVNIQNQEIRKPIKTRKMYQNYSNDIKLTSDSKINRLNDNRLTSNAPIYGRYYGHYQHNINCDRKENIPNVVDDCSMNLSLISDTVYFKKSLQNEIKNYNRKTHMLECDYSKEHGVFHNCSVKMYKQ